MTRSLVALGLCALVGGCIDFQDAQQVFCEKNPSACSDAGEAGDAGGADAGATDSGTGDGGTLNPDGGKALPPLRELVSAGGRMTGGTLTLDVQLGHPTPRTRMSGGTLSLTGSAAVQR
jgi:hypothetical protein